MQQNSKELTPTLVPGLKDELILDVACGCYHTLVLTTKNEVFAFGWNCHGQLGINNRVNQHEPVKLMISSAIQIAAGFYHSVVMVSYWEENKLANDLALLVNNQKHSDIIFKVEGKPIYAHWCIIMCWSEPLQIMMNGPMWESFENIIEIKDC